jgi:6-phosphogluconolactonase
MSERHFFDSRAELDRALAHHLALCLEQDIDQQGQASLAVSGGSTPTGMFVQLAGSQLSWKDVWLTLVDERCVPPDHEDSNERLVRENLLQGNAADARLVSMAGSREGRLEQIEQELATIPQPFSAVVLGMGGDGHTASWFPRAANLPMLLDPAATSRVAITDPVTAPHRRITLTLPAVLASRQIILHLCGDEKRAVLENAIQAQYPVAAILQQTTTPVTIWWAP